MTRPTAALATALVLAVAGPALASTEHNPWAAVDWAAMDADADGQISKAEFKAWLKKQKSAFSGKCDHWFKAIDTDKDGLITESELGAFLKG